MCAAIASGSSEKLAHCINYITSHRTEIPPDHPLLPLNKLAATHYATLEQRLIALKVAQLLIASGNQPSFTSFELCINNKNLGLLRLFALALPKQKLEQVLSQYQIDSTDYPYDLMGLALSRDDFETAEILRSSLAKYSNGFIENQLLKERWSGLIIQHINAVYKLKVNSITGKEIFFYNHKWPIFLH